MGDCGCGDNKKIVPITEKKVNVKAPQIKENSQANQGYDQDNPPEFVDPEKCVIKDPESIKHPKILNPPRKAECFCGNCKMIRHQAV
jgi:hypothetical protein